MAPVQVRGEVLSIRKAGDYHALTIVAPGISEGTRPGHFFGGIGLFTGSVGGLILAWLAVGLPLLWGVGMTVSKAAALFH